MIRAAGYRLTRRTAVGRRHVIGGKKVSAARGQRIRINITVGLTARIGSPGRRTCVDGEGRTRVGDDVIRQHTSRGVQRRGNVIGAPYYRLTRRTAVASRHVVSRKEVAAPRR